MPCPDENVLAAYADHGLDRSKRTEIEQHIASCGACRSLISELVRGLADTSDTVLESAPRTDPRPPAMTATFRMISGPGTDVRPPSMPRSRPTHEALRVDRQVQLVPGTLVGEYEVTGVIGSGGMGAVFSAVHPRIRKQAAIKVLNQQLARHPAEIVRFENEARAVNEIHHPNIVDIFGFGELTDGTPYFVMERVEGTSLQQWLDKRGALPVEKTIPILMPIFDALIAAHERGVVHRDLKPGNIMIGGADSQPRIKILDFGLAKMMTRQPGDDSEELTMPGVAMGTPLFMSPEQYLGGQIDHRTDIYALGVIIYQMVCAAYPFAGATPTLVALQHLDEPPPRPSSIVPTLPQALDDVVLKALAKNPSDRYATVAELRDALVRCSAPATIPASANASTVRMKPAAPAPVPVPAVELVTAAVAPQSSSPRRRDALVLGIGVAGAVALAAVTFLVLRTPPAETAAPSAPAAVIAPRATAPTAAVTPGAAPQHPVAPPVAPTQPPTTTPETPVTKVAPPPETPITKLTGKQFVRTGGKSKTTRTGPKTPPPAGSAKPPCDPYKSADGC